MRHAEKEERIQCRIGELTVLSFRKRLRITYFEAHDILTPGHRSMEEELRAAASEDLGSASGVFLWSIPTQGDPPPITWRRRRIVYIPRRYNRYFVTLKGRSFDDYLNDFSSKSRSTLRRKVRKFQEAAGGTIDFREFGTPDDIDRFYRDAGQISRVSYQHIMFDMGLPDTPAFKQGLEEAARRAAVRGYVLYLKEQPVAYLYCPFERGVLSYQYLGYLQDFRHLSPGTVLQMLAFERLFADDAAEYFDFTQGGAEGSHKDFYSTEGVACADVFILKPTVSNILFVISHYLTDRLSTHAGHLLERLNVKRHVKAAIRLVKGAKAK